MIFLVALPRDTGVPPIVENAHIRLADRKILCISHSPSKVGLGRFRAAKWPNNDIHRVGPKVLIQPSGKSTIALYTFRVLEPGFVLSMLCINNSSFFCEIAAPILLTAPVLGSSEVMQLLIFSYILSIMLRKSACVT